MRESASLTWYLESEGITACREVGERMQRAKGGNSNRGRSIHIWAKEAGFLGENIKKSAGSWCFSSSDERKYWGGSMEKRARSSGFAVTAIEEGFATQEHLKKIAMGWRAFVEDEDAWLRLLHGEILCWK